MDEANANAFRTRLREAIRSRGITQSELARQLGVRDATVSDWFNRGTMPNGAIMLQLPGVLDVSGHWLLTGEGQPRRSFTAGDAVAGLPDTDRARLSVLLELALQVVQGEATEGAENAALRPRRASADEARALDAARVHEGEQRSRGRRRSQGR